VSGQDFYRIELILRMIGHLRRRLHPLSLDDFLADIDEMDLTAFRLSVIGETTSRLSEALKARNPEINWPSIYGMRNLIVHDYGAIEPERLWAVFKRDIDPLAEVCHKEHARRD
jgi:uncharacterized protein with HEPN domain